MSEATVRHLATDVHKGIQSKIEKDTRFSKARMKPFKQFNPDVYIDAAPHTNIFQDHQAEVLQHIYTGLDV